MASYLLSYMDTIRAVPMSLSDLITVHSKFHVLHASVMLQIGGRLCTFRSLLDRDLCGIVGGLEKISKTNS